MKENENGILSDPKNCENDTASLASEINDKDGIWDESKVVENFRNDNENEARDSVFSSTVPSSKMGLFEANNWYPDRNGNEDEDRNENEFKTSAKIEVFESRELYTNKNVMQCELPELIICEKENTYHVVKDICVDEGVPFADKILIESENKRGICSFLLSNGNKNGAIKKEDSLESSSVDGSESSSVNDFEDDIREFRAKDDKDNELFIADSLKSLLGSHFDDEFVNTGKSLNLVQAADMDHNANQTMDNVLRKESVSSVSLTQNFTERRPLKSLLESPVSNGNKTEKQSSQIPCPEENLESPALVSTADEPKKSSSVNDITRSEEVESEITSLNSLKTEDDGRSENPGDVDHEQQIKVDSETKHEDGNSESLAVGRESQCVQGESSFSMAGPVSGLITYSGPIAYSGSISLRSDSSATSTRSFAFPVLQTEWSGSPVRMAKADRRRYRKHRGWRAGLFCCRF